MPKRERSPTGGLTKGPWTPEEDEALVQYVREHGEGNWNRVGRQTGVPRSGKSCRLRWLNHLRPDLKKGSFSDEEELLVVHLHARFGNKWSLMAAHLPGRTDNDIKNFWNTRAKRYESAGWPLYANPNAARAPIVPQTTFLPAQRLDFPGDVPTPLGFVQNNGNAALAYGREGTPALPRISSSVTSDLARFIQHADQSSKMVAVPGFSALHGADLEANRHLPSGTHYLPAYGPVSGTTMPELPSGQHLQTGQSSRGKASPLPLHQTVDTKRHQQLLMAENALLQRIGLPQAIRHAPQTSKTTTEGSDPQCNQIRSEDQSAWPAFNEQVPDSSGSSLSEIIIPSPHFSSNSNPEADNVSAQSNEDGQISRRIDVTRPDALLGLCQFFAEKKT